LTFKNVLTLLLIQEFGRFLKEEGLLHSSQKPNKDTTLLENLSPISLHNVDYKILTKTIAKRLEKVLPTIINPGQTGYVKGLISVKTFV